MEEEYFEKIKKEMELYSINERTITKTTLDYLEGTTCWIKLVYRPPRYLRGGCICGPNGQDPDCKCRLVGFDNLRATFLANSYSIGGGNGSNSVVGYGGGV